MESPIQKSLKLCFQAPTLVIDITSLPGRDEIISRHVLPCGRSLELLVPPCVDRCIPSCRWCRRNSCPPCAESSERQKTTHMHPHTLLCYSKISFHIKKIHLLFVKIYIVHNTKLPNGQMRARARMQPHKHTHTWEMFHCSCWACCTPYPCCCCGRGATPPICC